MKWFRWIAVVGLLGSLVVVAGSPTAALAQPEDQKLTGPVGTTFGTSVDLDGDTLVVGNNTEGPGAVYVYERQGGVWVEVQRLSPSTLEPLARFGAAVSVDGDWLAVGASGGIPSVEGATYMFERVGGSFVFRQRLDPELVLLTPGAVGYGADLDLDGSSLIVGAFRTELPGDVGFRPGSAYIYSESGGVWAQSQRLDGSTDFEGFGAFVALDGATAVVAATSALPFGRLVTFDGSSGTFVQAGEAFGDDILVAIHGPVDVDGDTSVAGVGTGARVYDGLALTQVDTVIPALVNNGGVDAIVVSGGRAVIGRSGQDTNGIVGSGQRM